MRLSLWPQSLFGRLLAASVAAVLLAQAVGLFLIAQEREGFVLQGSVREWSRRIAETTLMLQPLGAAERAAGVGRLAAAPACVRRRTNNYTCRTCSRVAAGTSRAPQDTASCACRCCRTSSGA